jgi:hypothetical protein
MTARPFTPPCRFDTSFEQIAADEAETIQALVDTLHALSEKTAADYGHAVRSVHAKSHALLQGELQVLDNLPEELAQGLFARAATYPVVMRISTNPGDILADSVSTPRGMALKVSGVQGERLAGSEGRSTQDFVMANAPSFSAATPKEFLGMLKLLAKTTDKAEGAKKALSAVMRGAEKTIEAVGGESTAIKNLGGEPATHPLGESFYTMAPLLYGPYYAKLSVAPISRDLCFLKDEQIHLRGRPDALREEINDFFATRGGTWEVRVQLATDPAKMPIEDAAAQWPEDVSPYVPVARITIEAQPAWTAARAVAVDDGMAFSPWNGLVEHRPLGGIMRSRKPAYEMSANFRSQKNGCPMHEPQGPIDLPED